MIYDKILVRLLIFCFCTTAVFATESYKDEFSAQEYNNSDGTLIWSQSWSESNDDDDAADGAIKVDNNQLYFDKIAGDMSIEREVDLDIPFSEITLTFDFDNGDIDNEKLKIELYDGSSWNTIGTIDKDSDSPFSYTLDTSEHSSNAKIRFSSDSEDWDTHGSMIFPTDDQLYIDNIQFEAFIDRDGDGLEGSDDIDDDNDGLIDEEEGLPVTGSMSDIFVISNDATLISSTEIQLTPAEDNKIGTAMSNHRINLHKDISFDFELYFGDDDGGADGIVFVLHNDPDGPDANGTDGSGMGAEGIKNGIGVEFDTWRNDENDNGSEDIDEDHTQIRDTDLSYEDTAGHITDVTALSPTDVETGEWYPVHIDWNATTSTLSYSFNDQDTITYTNKNIIDDYFDGSHLVYFGFTAATGGVHNDQRIRELVISFDTDTDNDGIDDYIDLDSDNDGIPDNVEGQSSSSYIAPSGSGSDMTDDDGDGLDDNYDNNTSGVPNSAKLNPPDSDNDNTLDYFDSDSDNDGYTDCEEGNKNADCANITVGANGMPNWADDGDDYSVVYGNVDDITEDLFNETGDTTELGYREYLCGKTEYSLTAYQWRLISVPCDTDNLTVNDLFSSILGTYGNNDNWVMYKQTGTTDNYEVNDTHKNTDKTMLTSDDTLEVGVSYWIIADEDHNITIDKTLSGLAPTSTTSATDEGIADDIVSQFRTHTLPDNSNDNEKKYMTGNPFPYRVDIAHLYFKHNTGDYNPMGNSVNDDYVYANIYTHDHSDTSDKNVTDGGGYIVLTTGTPGFTGDILPMEGFFIKVEKNSDETSNKLAYPLMMQSGN